jgi:hypothetical protein
MNILVYLSHARLELSLPSLLLITPKEKRTSRLEEIITFTRNKTLNYGLFHASPCVSEMVERNRRMLKKSLVTLAQSIAITAFAAAAALLTNAVRNKGIPLVAHVPYDIFSTCKDAESTSSAQSPTVSAWSSNALAVDASPKPQFEKEHVKDAVNAPYSVLFGASAEDIEAVRRAMKAEGASNIVVYGTFFAPADPSATVDLAKPLADQLTESGLKNVRHVEGGLDAMKKQGAPTVKGR